MLTVYSIQGSPGASTTAMHLAAQWALQGREILLIEADPAGGSLSHNLGIQFTPGSASFVASGLPVQSNHLIDHAQDVLFENLHVMPAPASPTGARGIFNTFADFSEELRTISENEMAVIIDGGRITTDTAASGLTTGAAGVVVVCRNNSQMSSLEHLKDMLAAGLGEGGPQGYAVTIGKSPLSPEEWQESCGLTFCGSIEIVADMATDLSAYLARSKRKSKKWRASLEEVGEKLYPYAQPPVSNRPRQPAAAAAPPDTEVSGDAGQATPAAAAPPDTEVSGDAGQATPAAATFDPAAQYPAGYGQAPPMAPVSQPGYGQSHYLPPTGWPTDAQSQSGPGYGQPTPPPYPPAQYPAQPYEQQPGTYEQQPQYPTQPGSYEQQPQYPTQPGSYEQQPGSYEQQPGSYEQQPGSYEQQPQYPTQPGSYEPQPGTHEQQPQHPVQPTYEAHEPPQHPAQPYEQPAGTYEQQPQYPMQPTYEAHEPPQHPAQPYEQPAAQPEPPAQEAAHPQPPESESPPRPNMKPTGSFRDWAVKLHGSNAQDTTAHRGG